MSMLSQIFRQRSAAVRLYSSRAAVSAAPTAKVPDTNAFLTQIGRNMTQYAEHFETWDSLMNADGNALKSKGMDTRDRRYLLGWIEKYKQNFELTEIKRGTKKWGGERNRRANRAAFYGRKAAEERENS